ncbi:MAG TPA: hypothetical protein VGL44_14355 [Gaiellales bacterium]|jgi:hypothetical protein
MWPFRRAPDLLARQREQLARDHARSSGHGRNADEDPRGGTSDADAEARAWKAFEEFEGFGPPPGVRPIKSWSGSVWGCSGGIVRLRVRSQSRDETPRETSFWGTPGQLLAPAVRRGLRSLLPGRGSRR